MLRTNFNPAITFTSFPAGGVLFSVRRRFNLRLTKKAIQKKLAPLKQFLGGPPTLLESGRPGNLLFDRREFKLP